MGRHSPDQINPQPAPLPEPESEYFDEGRRRLLIGAAWAGGLTVLGAGVGAAIQYERGGWPFEPGNEPQPGSSAHPNTHEGAGAPEPIEVPAAFEKAKKETAITDTWQMFGATQDAKDTMTVRASGWAVRSVDDTSFFPRQPQLLVGPRVATKGEGFGIAGRILNTASEEASVIFHSDQPDVILDEEVHRMPAVAVRVAEGKLHVDVFDGKKNEPAVTHELADAGEDGAADFWLHQTDDGLKVGSGKHSVAVKGDLFKKQVIFGADGNFVLGDLDVYATGDKPVEVIDTSTRKLPAISHDGFQGIVNAKGRTDLTIIDAVDLSSIEDNWDLLENVGGLETEFMAKLQAVYKGKPDANGNLKKEDFDFTEVHALIDLAKRSGNREVMLHALVWGEAMPKPVETFLRECIRTGNKKAALNFVKNHVGIMVDEFKDLVTTIDVVNEPMGDTGNDAEAVRPQEHLIFKATGGTLQQFAKDGYVEYIDVATATAKQHGAKRVRINENGLETGAERRTAFKRMVKRSAGKNVDAIGLQCHLDSSDYGDWVNDDADGRVDPTYVSDDLNEVVSELASDLDVEVDISELSVDAEDSDVENAEHIKAMVYAGVGNAAMRNKKVKNLGIWGLLTNKRYMTTTFNGDGSVDNGNDAPWKVANGKPAATPAVAAFKAGLRGDIHELA